MYEVQLSWEGPLIRHFVRRLCEWRRGLVDRTLDREKDHEELAVDRKADARVLTGGSRPGTPGKTPPPRIANQQLKVEGHSAERMRLHRSGLVSAVGVLRRGPAAKAQADLSGSPLPADLATRYARPRNWSCPGCAPGWGWTR